jgi:hypothetical protein
MAKTTMSLGADWVWEVVLRIEPKVGRRLEVNSTFWQRIARPCRFV